MKLLILIGGTSGSGKTGVSEFLVSNLIQEVKRFSADDFFSRNGTYHFQPELLSEAHNQCQEYVMNNMEISFPVIIVDNTFTKKSELDPYFELAWNYDYEVMSLVAVNHHGSKSIHGVPATTICRQAADLTTTIRDYALKPYQNEE